MGVFLLSMLHRSATFVFLLSLFWSTTLFGQRVIYVNGIMNTISDVEYSQSRIKDILTQSVNHTNNKRTFSIGYRHNPNGYTGIATNLSWNNWNVWGDLLLPLSQDKRELFMLKTAEEMYEDDFGQMLGIWGPGKTPIITSGTPNIDKQAAARVAAYADNMMNVDVSIKVTTSSPDTDVDMGPDSMTLTQQVVNDIVTDIILNGPAIVVAHSEGNLLANLAYAKLAARYGNDVRKMIAIVNLANTAKFSTNGFSLTHAGDGMLFRSADLFLYGGLENMPVFENWYRSTPLSTWDISSPTPTRFEVMPATFQVVNPAASVKADHGILETYLSDRAIEPTISTAAAFNFTPDANRFRDRFEDFVYFAAASLDAANTPSTFPSGFTAAAPMSYTRVCHQATALVDGTAIITGGASNGGATNTVERFNPTTNTFSTIGPLVNGRSHHSATLLPNGKILIAGGFVPNIGPSTSVELYDPATETSSVLGTLNEARGAHTATLLQNGKVLITGGTAGSEWTIASVEIFDPSLGTTRTVGYMSHGRVGHTATMLNSGQVILAGGYSGYCTYADIEQFDPATETITQVGSMSTSRREHNALLLPDGSILFVGGHTWWYYYGAVTSSVEKFNPDTKVITPVGNMFAPRGRTSAAQLTDGSVLITGGDQAGTCYHAGTDLFDYTTNTVSSGSMMSTTRFGHTATTLKDGRVLVTGGVGSDNTILATTEVFFR